MKIPKHLTAFNVYRKRKLAKQAKESAKKKSKVEAALSADESHNDLSMMSVKNDDSEVVGLAEEEKIDEEDRAEAVEEAWESDSQNEERNDSDGPSGSAKRVLRGVRKSLSKSEPMLRFKTKLKKPSSTHKLEPYRSFKIPHVKERSLKNRLFPRGPSAATTVPAFLVDSRVQAQRCFEWLIDPFTPEKFFRNIWEKKPLLLKRKQPDFYNGVFSTEELDKILRESHLEFTKNIDLTSYVDGERKTLNPDGRAYPAIVWDHYQNGCSVRLLNPQTYSRSVWKLCSILQEYLGSFVGANVYLTPAGSQGFAPHYDDIEAFILQLEGKKEWKVYAPLDDATTLPRFSSGNFKRSELTREPLITVELEPGDLMYFPRGFIHEAKTTDDEHSLHITLSASQKNTFGDLLEILLPQAIETAMNEDVEFRESLPINYLSYMGVANQEMIDPKRYDFMTKIDHLMKKLINHARVDAAVDQKAKGFIHDCLPPVLNETVKKASIHGGGERWNKGIITNTIELEPETEIKLIRHGVLRVVMEDDTVKIYHTLENSREYHEREPQYVDIGADKASSVEYLLRAYPSYVRIEALPPELLEDKMEVANLLFDKGLIVVKEAEEESEIDL